MTLGNQELCEVGVVGPIFQTRTLRLKEFKSQAVSNVMWDLNQDRQTPEPLLLTLLDPMRKQGVAQATHM